MTKPTKRCPCCGGEALLYFDAQGYNCQCIDCYLSTDWFDTPEEAIAAWDRRTNDGIATMTLEECEAIVGKPVFYRKATWASSDDPNNKTTVHLYRDKYVCFADDSPSDRLRAAQQSVAHHRLQQELEGEV